MRNSYQKIPIENGQWSRLETQSAGIFQFRNEDLKRLPRCLRIPNTVVLDNGSKFPGEEVLLRGLYELVNGEDKMSCLSLWMSVSTLF